ncbi:MAG: hypothetical protein JWR69_2588 [Pedosphaera sp.]|nr:hypothetical protein [Pedosphaera sp.]
MAARRRSLNSSTNLNLRMPVEISERDWKVFRELRPVALGRLCDQILAEAKSTIERPGKSSHEKYLSLYKLIQERDDDIARGFNDFRRSTALGQIGIIHKQGLFTGEELHRFSPETLRIVEMYAPIPNA